MIPLSPTLLKETLQKHFPKQNDTEDTDYLEELDELLHFGINTVDQLNELLETHKEEVLKIDGEPLDEFLINFLEEEIGKEETHDMAKNGYYYALSGLLRIALQLEFGDRYEDFANQRDGVS